MQKSRWLAVGVIIGIALVMNFACDKKPVSIGQDVKARLPCEVTLSEVSQRGPVGLGIEEWMTFEVSNPNDHKVGIRQIALEWIACDATYTGWLTGQTVILKDQFNIALAYAYTGQGPLRFKPSFPYWIESRTTVKFSIYMDPINAAQNDWAQFYVVAIDIKDDQQRSVGIKKTPLTGNKVYINLLFPVTCQISSNSPIGQTPRDMTEVLRFSIKNCSPTEYISIQNFQLQMLTTDIAVINWPSFSRQWQLFEVSQSPTLLLTTTLGGGQMTLGFFDIIAPGVTKEYSLRGNMIGASVGDTLQMCLNHVTAIRNGFVISVGGDPNAQGSLVEGNVLIFY